MIFKQYYLSCRSHASYLVRLARVGIDQVTDVDSLIRHEDLTERQSRLTVRQADERVAADLSLQVVDVRGPGEHTAAAPPWAVNLPITRLLTSIEALDSARPVLLHCAGGFRSIAAASALRVRGFVDVPDLLDGWAAWTAENATAAS